MRLIFMGTSEFAVPSLERLIASGYEIAAVYTQPDKPVGRGRVMTPSPVKRLAMEYKIPVVEPVSFKKPDVIEQFLAFKADVVIVAAYGKILPDAVLNTPRFGCINLHASLLPRHRGAAPIAAAILAGDVFTGVTIMLVTPKLDTGPLLVRAAVQIGENDTTGTLTEKLALVGAAVLDDTLVRWFRGAIQPRPQEEAEATYQPVFTKEQGLIDWSRTAVEISRQVRAFNPWPGTYTRWNGKSLKIIHAEAASGVDALAEIGEVWHIQNPAGNFYGVQTGSGVLRIISVQLEGKKVQPAADFVRGYPQFVNSRLG